MEKANKSDFIDVYVLKTLNEIKNTVKRNIKIDPKREEEIDKKMSKVLNDLINANFKNLQMDPKGNLLYTFLPIVDESENKKVRLSLVLYYTALYYDNLELLNELLKEDVRLDYDWYITLQYLDKSISSKFEMKDYIEKVKRFGYIFRNFVKSIENVPEEKRAVYISRFVKLFNLKYEDICNVMKENNRWTSTPLEKLFTKDSLDTFEDNAYLFANSEQLELINFCGETKLKEENRIRLNNLVLNKGYSNRLYDFDLMMRLFTDEELDTLSWDVSCFLSHFSRNERMLKKALEFVKLRPDLVNGATCMSEELFMEKSNYVLIETLDFMYNHSYIRNEENIEFFAKTMAPKATLKRVFGAYKKRN